MKKILSIIVVVTLLSISSCTVRVTDGDNQTLYVTTQDKEVIIYKHGSKTPLILKRPVSIEDLQKNQIPQSVIIMSENNQGMVRYVNGKKNDVYNISAGAFFFILVSLCLALGRRSKRKLG